MFGTSCMLLLLLLLLLSEEMPGVSSRFAQNSASRGPSSKTIKARITFLTICLWLKGMADVIGTENVALCHMFVKRPYV